MESSSRSRVAKRMAIGGLLWRAFGMVLLVITVSGCQSSMPRRDNLSTALRRYSTPDRATASAASTDVIRAVQYVAPTASASNDRPSSSDESPEELPARPLTLPDLEEMAIMSNPSVAKARALVESARGNWLQVGLPPNPTVGYEGQQIGSRGLAEQDGVFVGQEIVRGGKLRLNREIAAQEVAKAEHLLAVQEQRVLTDVRIAFYQVLIAQEQEKVVGELRRIAAENLKGAEVREAAKDVAKLDVIQARLELNNVAILVENARNRARAAWRTLAAIVGNSDLPSQTVEGDLTGEREVHDWNSTLERLVSSSPEIAAAMAEIERARWAAERARVEKIPNLSVQGLVNVRDNGIGGRSDGSIMVGIPLPLWNRNQGAIVQTAQAARAAEHALEQLERSLEKRLAPVFERYSNASNQVTKYRDSILPEAKESLELTRIIYQAGETSYLTLLTAQRTYSQTSLNYLDALRELRTAEAELEGLLLTNSLESQ